MRTGGMKKNFSDSKKVTEGLQDDSPIKKRGPHEPQDPKRVKKQLKTAVGVIVLVLMAVTAGMWYDGYGRIETSSEVRRAVTLLAFLAAIVAWKLWLSVLFKLLLGLGVIALVHNLLFSNVFNRRPADNGKPASGPQTLVETPETPTTTNQPGVNSKRDHIQPRVSGPNKPLDAPTKSSTKASENSGNLHDSKEFDPKLKQKTGEQKKIEDEQAERKKKDALDEKDADARLSVVRTLVRNGKRDLAIRFAKEIIDRYPKTSAAKTAQIIINELSDK